MPNYTDLPEWKSLTKQEKALLKTDIAIKSYKNFDGEGSVSAKELAKGDAYQKKVKVELVKEVANG